MNPILRNVLAVLAGIVVGSLVNAGLVLLGSSIIPLPEAIDVMNPDSIKENMHLLEFKHFIFPFLAHALGTLVGAFAAAKIAIGNKLYYGLGIGAWFLVMGIINISTIGGPLWFTVVDLVAAYIPMGWLGGRMARG